MSLPLHLLRTFAAVVREQGFSRAAAAIHVSQPAVSRAVRELEGQAGVTLIDRGPGPLRLTEAGRTLYRHARDVFAAERAAEEALLALRGLAQGALTVGASTTVATYHLPPVLAAFAQHHPDVTLRLESANTRAIVERLLDRDLDLAFVEGPVADARVSVTPWRTEPLVIVSPAGRAAPDLGTARFLVREPGSGTRDEAEAGLRALGLVAAGTLEVGSTEAIKQCVAAGLGVALLPLSAVADLRALGRLVVLPNAALHRTLSRLALPGRTPSPAAAAFDAILAAMPPADAAPSGTPHPLEAS